MTPAAQRLLNLLRGTDLLVMPCCFDALSARLVERAGFPLLNSAVFAMQEALADLKAGRTHTRRVDFATIRDLVGFSDYDRTLGRYAAGPGQTGSDTPDAPPCTPGTDP